MDPKAAFQDSVCIPTSKKPDTQPREVFPYQARQRLQLDKLYIVDD